MKNDEFPLAAVKEWRENRKKMAEQSLAEAIAAEHEAQRDWQAALANWEALATVTGSGSRWAAGARFQATVALQFEREHCTRLADLAATAQRLVTERRIAVAEARRSLELVLRLEEKWLAETRRQEQRRAQGLLDEIAQSRVFRARQEEAA